MTTALPSVPSRGASHAGPLIPSPHSPSLCGFLFFLPDGPSWLPSWDPFTPCTPSIRGLPGLILGLLLCLLFLILAQVALTQSLQGVLPPERPARGSHSLLD